MLKVSPTFVLFSKLTLLALLFTTLMRLTFFLFNTQYFHEVGLLPFLYGLRFDSITIAFAFSPVYILLLFPYKTIPEKLITFIRVYSLIVLGIFSAVNFIDVIYYRFTLKRTTWDIFNYVNAGDDFGKLLPQFILDFWYVIALFFIFMYLIYKILNKFLKTNAAVAAPQRRWFSIVLMLSILALGFRGGAQLKPLNIMDASRYGNGQNTALLLSTPFTLMKSMGKEQLTKLEFMDEDLATNYFNPAFKITSDSASKKNVVVIIMESLSKEYVGYFNSKSTYTPFLDSLMNRSIVFTNAFANGKRSIEALPAIFSSLPNLMNDAINTSPYAGNKLSSLAFILKEEGYNSSFFHGGANGTMGFDSYTKMAGFDAYFGMDQYPNEADYDGLWGIFDEPFFQFVATTQGELNQPFLSSFFSLSAHHPYTLPEEYIDECAEGALEIFPLICYSDFALRKYFETVGKTSWYKNTIFLITADHTAQNVSAEYGSSVGIYSIPIVLFDPMNPKGINVSRTTQQTDITPTILDYLNMPTNAILFGQSALDSTNKGFAINYLNNTYQFIDDSSCIRFNGSDVTAMFNYKRDKLLSKNVLSSSTNNSNLEVENKMKAIIQQYNERMIENKLTTND